MIVYSNMEAEKIPERMKIQHPYNPGYDTIYLPLLNSLGKR